MKWLITVGAIEGPDTGTRLAEMNFGAFPGLHCCAFIVLDGGEKPGFWGKSKAKPSEADAGRAKSGGVASLVAVFDFDRTLTSVHAGPFDLGPDVVNRLFGGA